MGRITSNTYWDWIFDHVFVRVPAQAMVGEFLATLKEFPPRQKAASEACLSRVRCGAI